MRKPLLKGLLVDWHDEKLRGVSVLVTGGLGFIGSNVACRLADLGADVLAVDAMMANCGGNLANIAGYEDRIKVDRTDLSQDANLDRLVEGRQIILNCAGRVAHYDSMVNPIADLDSNVVAQVNLLEACRRSAPQAAIVFTSTRQIYGKPQNLPVDEQHPLRPVDVNGINKLASEHYHQLYHDIHGLHVVSLRLTNTFGPRMRIKDARQTFLGVWLRAVVEERSFEVWGGDQLRDFSYIDDVVEAMLLAATVSACWGQIYNIGGTPPVSLLALAEQLVQIAGTGRFERKVFPAERKAIDIGDYFADDTKFRRATDWSPKWSLEAGLAAALDYYRRYLDCYV
ncbi:NAD-dependent epimerase/dehydratase family protein [Oryzibacter oryziterrae]|uniref:NAD-dependent epimerase/dehydratase family protein n=1 Tax=Oryzibacter oryziterrae TaxID=2766474 RepID=UPI001F01688A|nr:NAD-dependent epimerase/dehydratase family protein [Oryzibacter oryziterrae]